MRLVATSNRFGRDKYLFCLKWFSNSKSCCDVKAVRGRRVLPGGSSPWPDREDGRKWQSQKRGKPVRKSEIGEKKMIINNRTQHQNNRNGGDFAILLENRLKKNRLYLLSLFFIHFPNYIRSYSLISFSYSLYSLTLIPSIINLSHLSFNMFCLF